MYTRAPLNSRSSRAFSAGCFHELPPKKIEKWSLTSLQQRLVKTGGRLINRCWRLVKDQLPILCGSTSRRRSAALRLARALGEFHSVFLFVLSFWSRTAGEESAVCNSDLVFKVRGLSISRAQTPQSSKTPNCARRASKTISRPQGAGQRGWLPSPWRAA